MEIQKFIDILDKKGKIASSFFKKKGKEILKSDKLLLKLLDLSWSKKKYLKLTRLSWIICVELGGRHFGEEKHFDIISIYERFQEYMYENTFIEERGMLFEDWEDLAKEKVDLLKILVQEDKLGRFKGDQRFKKFSKKYAKGCDKVEFKRLQRLAKRGCGDSQRELGKKYIDGEGVAKDYKMALHWYKKSAKKECVYAQHDLGVMYVHGIGVEKDYKKAFYWFKKAAEQGDPYSQVSFGKLYAEGMGVPQDYKEAFYWYKKSAEKKCALAQYEIGEMYAKGMGMPQDYKKAFYWFHAAQKNYLPAQYKLGEMYAKGQGVSQSDQQAYVRFSVCLKLGQDKDGVVKKARDEVMSRLNSKALKEAKKQAKEIRNSIVFSFSTMEQFD